MKKNIDPMDVFIGNYFTDLRIDHRYTQTQVCDLLNLSQSTYCGYERGTRALPLNVMKKLCILYHLDFYEVFKYLDKETERLGLQK